MLRKIKRLSIRPVEILLTILTPILLILAFPDFHLSYLVWVALIPLFFLLDRSSRLRSFVLSYIAGFIFFGGVMYWLVYVSKLGFFILIPVLALFFALFGLIGNIFLRRSRNSRLYILSFLILPSLWVALEYIRGIFLTGFPWAILGYTQYRDLFVIQIADITGPYGVSFIIVMANYLLYHSFLAAGEKFLGLYNIYYRDIRILKYQAVAAVLILAASFSYGFYSLQKEDVDSGVKMSVVQGNIPQHKKWDPAYKDFILERYERLTRDAAKDKGDLIIWPETSVPGYLFERDIYLRITDLAKEVDIPLFLGLVLYTWDEEGNGRYFNTASLMSADGNIEREYHKLHLVPLGEYVPFGKLSPFIRDFVNVPIGDFSPGQELTLFDINKDGTDLKYAALICFEDIFPDLVRRFALKGADILINMTNDAWFRESSAQLQHTQASVFRAVENRTSVVRAANTGFSCYISPKGKIEDAIYDTEAKSMYIKGHKTFNVEVSKANSLYTQLGDIFAYLCIFFVLTFLAITYNIYNKITG